MTRLGLLWLRIELRWASIRKEEAIPDIEEVVLVDPMQQGHGWGTWFSGDKCRLLFEIGPDHLFLCFSSFHVSGCWILQLHCFLVILLSLLFCFFDLILIGASLFIPFSSQSTLPHVTYLQFILLGFTVISAHYLDFLHDCSYSFESMMDAAFSFCTAFFFKKSALE